MPRRGGLVHHVPANEADILVSRTHQQGGLQGAWSSSLGGHLDVGEKVMHVTVDACEVTLSPILGCV